MRARISTDFTASTRPTKFVDGAISRTSTGWTTTAGGGACAVAAKEMDKAAAAVATETQVLRDRIANGHMRAPPCWRVLMRVHKQAEPKGFSSGNVAAGMDETWISLFG